MPTESKASAEELKDLRDSVRSYFTARSPESEVRRHMAEPPGYDSTMWKEMSTQLGMQGIAIPTEFGGAGYGPMESAIVLEEMGRLLVCSPYLASVGLAATVLLHSDDPMSMAEFLPGIADGTTIACVAWPQRRTRASVPEATVDGDGWNVNGPCRYVLSGACADLLLVSARESAGLSLFAVRVGDGVDLLPLEVLDGTRPQAVVSLAGARAQRVGAPGEADAILERAFPTVAALLAAEHLGSAQACLDMALGYAVQRVQFGRIIGSFQAVKHTLVDLTLAVELARGAVEDALLALQDGADRRAIAASVAACSSSQALSQVAEENIQIHGGIGVTWEHPAHLYFRRAKAAESLLATPSEHRSRLAELLRPVEG